MHRRKLLRLLVLGALTGLGLAARAGTAENGETPAAYNATAWREDLTWLEHELEQRYPSLGWDATGQGDVDLVASHRIVERDLAAARDDEAAKRALEVFVASFHDGHLRPLQPAPRPGQPASLHVHPSGLALAASGNAHSLAAAPADSQSKTAVPQVPEACAVLDVESANRPGLTFSGASLPGLISASPSEDIFPSAIVASPRGLHIGIVRIASFTQIHYPTLCRQAVRELVDQRRKPTAPEVRAAMKDDWLDSLAKTLARMKSSKVDALVVDIEHNYGGNDFGDWAVRMFTVAPVHSARLLMVSAPGAGTYADEELDNLRHGLGLLHDDQPELIAKFRESIGAFEMRRSRLTAKPTCEDPSWVWHEHRPWTPGLCDRLIDMGYASGSFDYLPPVAPALADAFSYAYWPAVVDQYRGAWAGPVYVLTDSEVYSAAEMFAASMRDNGIARIIGQRTGRAGCGSMAKSEPIELPHSGLRFNLPNCVRLRADGSDEIAGIEPDIAFARMPGEIDEAAAARLFDIVSSDLQHGGVAYRQLPRQRQR